MPDWIDRALPVLPGALIVYLSFNAGGFFPGTQALAAIIVWVLLAAWIAIAERPFAAVSWPLAATVAALAAFAVWILISPGELGSGARSLLEFNRILVYLGALLLFGLSIRSAVQIRWLIWGLAVGITVVCAVALLTRLMPDVFPTAPGVDDERLSFPLTYWNALGLLGSIGVILCLHLASRASGPRPPRVLAAGAIPILVTTIYFTFSRGAIAAAIIGVVAYLVIGRPRGLPSSVLAVAAPTAVALLVAYGADLLAGPNPTAEPAADQGHEVAIVVAACVVAALALRFVLLSLDRRLARMPPLSRHSRQRVRIGAAVALVAAVIVAVVLGLPGEIKTQYDRFATDVPVSSGDVRERLTETGSPARVRQWRVALDQFDRAEVAGEGAGTWVIAWNRDRPVLSTVNDAHSLYLEVLGELGIVGGVLLVGVIVAILGAFALAARGPNRPGYAALLAAGLAWAAHAGVDWDWEMPAVTIWLFAAGGMALALRGSRPLRSFAPPLIGRLLVAVPLVLITIVPFKVLSSEAWLDRGRDAFARDACGPASNDAEQSLEALDSRPEPYELLGYCAIRDGDFEGAVAAMQKAIDRDPENWNFRYGLALAQGASGADPRPAAHAAAILNPLDPLVTTAVEAFDTDRPELWERRARFLARQLRTLS